jgi:hypothetical protein
LWLVDLRGQLLKKMADALYVPTSCRSWRAIGVGKSFLLQCTDTLLRERNLDFVVDVTHPSTLYEKFILGKQCMVLSHCSNLCVKFLPVFGRRIWTGGKSTCQTGFHFYLSR